MSSTHRALISWIGPEHGGRQHPPSGPRYVTVARFEEDEKWPESAWSLTVDFLRKFDDPRLLLAEVAFLVQEAPHQLLHDGSRFTLLEGRRFVAKGVILASRVAVPEKLTEFECALIG